MATTRDTCYQCLCFYTWIVVIELETIPHYLPTNSHMNAGLRNYRDSLLKLHLRRDIANATFSDTESAIPSLNVADNSTYVTDLKLKIKLYRRRNLK
jgi:hypothetical protein